MTTQLAKRELNGIEKAVAKREVNFVRRAAHIVSSAMRAPDLPAKLETDEDGNQILPEGWTMKDFRIAVDATKTSQSAPIYLKMASDAFVNAQRLAAAGRQAPAAAIQIIFNQSEAPKYDVIDVEAVEKK